MPVNGNRSQPMRAKSQTSDRMENEYMTTLFVIASTLYVMVASSPQADFSAPANFPHPPANASGYPSRDANLDLQAGFSTPPPGYGEVPFWWWTGDPLDKDRLLWQIEQLHEKGISGMQVNYSHEDTPGMPTSKVEPEIFSDAWWDVWKFVAGECSKRDMGIGLSGYTLDWPNGQSLVSRTIYNDPEIQGREIEIAIKQKVEVGHPFVHDLPADTVAVRAYPLDTAGFGPGNIDLADLIREQRLEWTPNQGEWEVWVFTATRKSGTLNPIHPLSGQRIIERFFQPFEDHAPGRSPAGLNYFFHDELQFGVGDCIWSEDLAREFQQRKGYDLFEALPAMFQDTGVKTVKYRLDFMDIKVRLAQERYFIPIFQWHWSRGKIYGCDQGSRGRDPLEFGDYFSAVRWYTAPGHDTPGGKADLIKGKVSSSIAHLYKRPRVWLEGYHSLGWGATPENLMFATCENYLYGCNLLNLHGLYYTTHGSFWEWAPPCYHFRMPYWEHMGTFLKYFERLSYLMSQGVHQCDVAVLYPVSPGQARLGGKEATEAAFAAGDTLFNNGCDFIFMDDESLERAEIHDGRLHVAGASYRVLIFPAMRAVRWSTLQKAWDFYRAGGIVIAGGALPEASDHAGSEDPELDAIVKEMFGVTTDAAWSTLIDQINGMVVRDVQAEQGVKATHRKIGQQDVYMVMGASKNSVVEFRAKGRVELWDPWTGTVQPLRVVGETETGTKVELPLEEYEAQIVAFTAECQHINPPPRQDNEVQQIALDDKWACELKPTMDNRYGDFRLPVTDKIIGPEARTFRHAIETGDTAAWHKPNFDDSSWEKVTYDFGPQFWVLGPFPTDVNNDALEAELTKLTQINPQEAVSIAGKELHWRPYSFSWRQGLEGDPGHQGYHGLKEKVTDHFLCLGKRDNAHNEFKYEAEREGSRYYVWTNATVDQQTTAHIIASAAKENEQPHASEVLTPAAVFLNGKPIKNVTEPVSLQSGANPILIRYDHAGRGYFVLKRDEPDANLNERTPLSMTWFDDPSVIRFDVYAGEKPAEWFRFTAPPGLRAMTVTVQGAVEAWANGQPMSITGEGRFEVETPLSRAAVVALRVRPNTGFSGAAVFPEPVRLECGTGIIPLGDWSKMGALECYSGGMIYRKHFALSAEQTAGQVVIDLGRVCATAEVRINGQTAGVKIAPPWTVDISKLVKSGKNQIEVIVYNTLSNHYSTIPTRYRGPLDSGLIGPVSIQIN
jgi:hypothetical protein